MSKVARSKIKHSFLLTRILPTVLVALLIGWLGHMFVFGSALVGGDAMSPSLADRQYVFINHLSDIKRGDVIAFKGQQADPRHPKAGPYVQRVIALSGDTVRFDGQQIYVNGKKINQSYLSSKQRQLGSALSFGDQWTLSTLSDNKLWKQSDRKQTKVPKGSYFVLGDYRQSANDSRYFGFVCQRAVIGRVVLPVWANSHQRQLINQTRQAFFAK